MNYTTTDLINASESLFEPFKPVTIVEQLNQWLLKRHIPRNITNAVYITPHPAPMHRDEIIELIAKKIDRMMIVTPNIINSRWMNILYNSTKAVCRLSQPPTDIPGLTKVKQEWIILTYGIDIDKFEDEMSAFGLVLRKWAGRPSDSISSETGRSVGVNLTRREIARLRADGKPAPKLIIHDRRVKHDQEELKHEPTASELRQKMVENRTRIKKPKTEEELKAVEEKIANRITEIKAEIEASDSELEKYKLNKAIRSQQSLRSQYRRHFRELTGE